MRKKLILIPALLLFVGASPQKVEQPKAIFQKQVTYPLSTKLDSTNLKAIELNNTLRSL